MSNNNPPLRLRPHRLLFPLGLHHLLHVKILHENQKKDGGGGGVGGVRSEGLLTGARAALKGSGGAGPRGWGKWDKAVGLIKSAEKAAASPG